MPQIRCRLISSRFKDFCFSNTLYIFFLEQQQALASLDLLVYCLDQGFISFKVGKISVLFCLTFSFFYYHWAGFLARNRQHLWFLFFFYQRAGPIFQVLSLVYVSVVITSEFRDLSVVHNDFRFYFIQLNQIQQVLAI